MSYSNEVLDNPGALDVLQRMVVNKVDYETGQSANPIWTRVMNRRAEDKRAPKAEQRTWPW